jgi:hypothetical protein
LYSPRFIYPFIRFNLSFLFIAQSAKWFGTRHYR